MSVKKVLKDIPESDVREVVRSFEREGCTVEKEKQPDGKWTVRATCPES